MCVQSSYTGRGAVVGHITKRVALLLHPDPRSARNICCHRGRYPGICCADVRPRAFDMARGPLMQRCCTVARVCQARAAASRLYNVQRDACELR
jgi:hypothetical protein